MNARSGLRGNNCHGRNCRIHLNIVLLPEGGGGLVARFIVPFLSFRTLPWVNFSFDKEETLLWKVYSHCNYFYIPSLCPPQFNLIFPEIREFDILFVHKRQ